ncbi:hypothetical protein HKX48_006603 [Thoreauomyces humboldtii]|nr:hypothetical protein HKX48_006603 [Thoreauomyces humboldtii]
MRSSLAIASLVQAFIGLVSLPSSVLGDVGQISLENGFYQRLASTAHSRGLVAHGRKGVMLMNRIGPSSATLFIANADGTNERQLLSAKDSKFDYHGSFTPDGKEITFTSERNGDGQSDLYRVNIDGTKLRKVLGTPSFEDALVLNHDKTKGAYVSTANGYQANVWIKDLRTGHVSCITRQARASADSSSPNGYFSPSWSPDGEWIAFASDRNTGWTGHGNGTGWEHTQAMAIYAIRPDGTGLRQVVKKQDYSLGAPKWSPDGKRIVYHEMTREQTWNCHRPESLDSTDTQIVSIDFSGTDRREETSGAGMKLQPSYVGNNTIGYLVKGPRSRAGLNYTSHAVHPFVSGTFRSPSWSPDGKLVVYEKYDNTVRKMEAPLYSWDNEWDYRFTDVFPVLSRQGKLAMTSKQTGDSSIVTMNPNTTDYQVVFDDVASGKISGGAAGMGLAGAFQPDWSPDGGEIAFGLGAWFQARAQFTAWIFRASANGSIIHNGTSYEQLTDGSVNSGFPTYSHDGKTLVFRVWGGSPAQFGLRVMNLADKSIKVLTTGLDNLPHFSPDGTKIVFTRRMNATNYDVCTIKPDGSELQVLTSSGANDAHATWTADGRILWSSGMNGFRVEAATYDDTFQPYGQIFVMNADGSNKRMITDSMWEDSMPLYLPNKVLSV